MAAAVAAAASSAVVPAVAPASFRGPAVAAVPSALRVSPARTTEQQHPAGAPGGGGGAAMVVDVDAEPIRADVGTTASSATPAA